MRRKGVDYEICPADFLPVIAVSSAGDCCWYDAESSFETVVAHLNGDIIGALSFTRERNGVLTVHVIWVEENFRKRGVGRQMLDLLGPTRLRTEVISDDGLAFFDAARSRYKVKIYDGRQLSFRYF